MTDTLKTEGGKRLWFWGEELDKALEELKRRFTSAPLLAHFYPDRKTVIETDASDFAPGCILPNTWENVCTLLHSTHES